ncbi:MAG: DEAD/DEAH box helicase, partial [Candidatus Bathyarchaeia archaeon]
MTIEWVTEPFDDEESLASLAPYVRRWFKSKFSQLTPPQRFSFKLISEGSNVVIASPTGSGKTFAAFMVILSELFKMG